MYNSRRTMYSSHTLRDLSSTEQIKGAKLGCMLLRAVRKWQHGDAHIDNGAVGLLSHAFYPRFHPVDHRLPQNADDVDFIVAQHFRLLKYRSSSRLRY